MASSADRRRDREAKVATRCRRIAHINMSSVARVISNNEKHQRLSIAIRGAVQGVGFRPFVHRLATELGLTGWVRNSSQGVFIDVEGGREKLDQFLKRLH